MPDENDLDQTELPTQLTRESDAGLPDVPADTVDPVALHDAAPQTRREPKVGGRVPVWALLLVAVVPAAIVGVAVWFLASAASGGGAGRLEADASNILGAFTSGAADTTTTRYEGELPAGYPSDIPVYDGANVVAGIAQVQDENIQYIVMLDTGDGRDQVAAALKEQFDADPWQIDLGQDGRDLTLYQFSRIDDPDVSGVVLISPSKDDKHTTIITSVEQISGAADREADPFEPVASRAAPEGFPDETVPYAGAIVIDAAYQKDGARGHLPCLTSRRMARPRCSRTIGPSWRMRG